MSPFLRRCLFATPLVLPLAIACSGSTANTGGSGTGGSSDKDAFFSSYCSVFAKCCATLNKPTDGATCRSLFGALGASYTYDPVKGQACLDELNAASSAPDFCATAGSDQNEPSCKQALAQGGGGAKQPGDTCTQSSDCASSPDGSVACQTYFSTDGGNAQTRICQVQIHGKAGDTPCVGTVDGNVTFYSGSNNTPVPKGYICDKANGVRCDDKTVTCIALVPTGGSCVNGGSDACVTTAYCDTTAKCVDKLAAGADCSASAFQSSCQDKLYCDSGTKKCTPALAIGQACTSSDQCTPNSCVNKVCTGSSLGLSLLCGG